LSEPEGPNEGQDATLTLAAAAHELKNALAPLALRLARFEVAAKAGRAAPLEEVRLARSELRRLSGLVNELMDDARYRDGGTMLAKRPVDLAELVATLAATTAATWEGRRDLVVAPFAPAAWVHADDARLRAVLENFLDNADKFAPASTPVEVSLAVEGDSFRVNVRDHGPGVATSDQARLFTRFFRASATANSTRGFGLGLYLCREIARAHGGEVGVDSTPGAGATFWLTLPRAT
jgi:signal transduction histidine kinase